MKGDYLLHFIDGTFQFDYRGATITKKFFAPIRYDKDSRDTSVKPSCKISAASVAASVESTSTWRQRSVGYSSGATRHGPARRLPWGCSTGSR